MATVALALCPDAVADGAAIEDVLFMSGAVAPVSEEVPLELGALVAPDAPVWSWVPEAPGAAVLLDAPEVVSSIVVEGDEPVCATAAPAISPLAATALNRSVNLISRLSLETVQFARAASSALGRGQGDTGAASRFALTTLAKLGSSAFTPS
jgi:hypothetical protein